MQNPDMAPVAVSVQAYRANLRQLQEQALQSFYAATCVAGFFLLLLTIQVPALWRAGFLGLFLVSVPFPVSFLLHGSYTARVWALEALWCGALLGGALWLEAAPAPLLFVLPVVLAQLMLGIGPALLLATAVTLAPAVVTLEALGPAGSLWLGGCGVVWSVITVLWLGLKPALDALAWSWDHYEQARSAAEHARERQADLRQALKDLADAGATMVRLNQMLAVSRRVAEDAERAKAEFVANVSHELRTPLNMIVGFSEMMLQSPRTYGRLSAAVRADLDVILRNSQHLSALINDVLDLSQIEAGQMALTRERVSLGEIVQAAAEAIRPLYQSKGLYLRVLVPGGIELFGDRTRLREVLLNLLSNAGRFTEQGGVEVRADVQGQDVTVCVRDTGPGISAEDQQKLFQPFHQVDSSLRRRKGGSGLGLSISKHFIEMHGGRMWLESTPGQGTSFFFDLPIEPPASSGTQPTRWINPEWEYHERTRPWLAPRPEYRPRLVVVEKSKTLQRLLTRYVRDADVVAAADLDAAMQEIARQPAHALLVNDTAALPAVERLSTPAGLPEGMPALVCSLPAEQDAANALGAAGYLIKPVSRAVLLASLEQLQVMKGTVLIVDDEPETVRLFWRMLISSKRGYRVLTANNGQQALSILRHQRPDVVLLDMTMPGVDGFQILNLRSGEEWRDVPFLVVSASDPAGHPVVTKALWITRGGGLSLAHVLRYVEVISGQIVEAATEQSERPMPPAGQPA